ncbi:MAG: hypothetical protein ABI251_13835, partial [Mycobacteriaceae bacterium]
MLFAAAVHPRPQREAVLVLLKVEGIRVRRPGTAGVGGEQPQPLRPAVLAHVPHPPRQLLQGGDSLRGQGAAVVLGAAGGHPPPQQITAM